MILPDTNLLIYAYDQSSPFHTRAKAWCERLMTGPAPVILLPSVVFGFVRIATHPRVFQEPLAVGEAAALVRSWLARRRCHFVNASSSFSRCVSSRGGGAGGCNLAGCQCV